VVIVGLMLLKPLLKDYILLQEININNSLSKKILIVHLTRNQDVMVVSCNMLMNTQENMDPQNIVINHTLDLLIVMINAIMILNTKQIMFNLYLDMDQLIIVML